jgi:hypothetical protein
MGVLGRHMLFVFYLEVWNTKRWFVSGDDVPPKERAFIISNHPSEVRAHHHRTEALPTGRRDVTDAHRHSLCGAHYVVTMRQVDWMCWWPIAYRKGMVGDLRVILKKVPSSCSLLLLLDLSGDKSQSGLMSRPC